LKILLPTATVIEKAGSSADNRVKEKYEKYEKNWKLHQGTNFGRSHPSVNRSPRWRLGET